MKITYNIIAINEGFCVEEYINNSKPTKLFEGSFEECASYANEWGIKVNGLN